MRRSTTWIFALGAAAAVAASCSSKDRSDDHRVVDPCEEFCSALEAGEGCQDVSLDQCTSECAQATAICTDEAEAFLLCVELLDFTCAGPNYATATGNNDPGSIVVVSTPSFQLDVHDEECGQKGVLYQTCMASAGGTGGAGAGGSGSGAGTSSSSIESSSSATASSTGSGGCPPDHPVDCGTGTCWTADVDCSSIVDCGGDYVACSVDETAADMVVDCTFKDCVATPSTCAANASYPVYCPARHGAPPACWSLGTECNTVVRCAGAIDRSCDAPDHAVDCKNAACLAPVSAESNDAACSDGMDNDGNGYVDCADLHCRANPTITVCDGENDEAACSNGADDDGNGYTDCSDLSCATSPSVESCGGEHDETACHDTADNDADGKIDCADASCYGSAFVTCP